MSGKNEINTAANGCIKEGDVDHKRRSVLKLAGASAIAPVILSACGGDANSSSAPGAVGVDSNIVNPKEPPVATGTANPAPVPGNGISTPLRRSNSELWYSRPGVNWASDAIPMGNGRLGVMLLGGTNVDLIQFNENSLFSGPYNSVQSPGNATGSMGSYQNFGSAIISFSNFPGVSYATQATNPGVVSGETVENTIDGNVNTKWYIYKMGGWIDWLLTCSESKILNSYAISSANDQPQRDPKSWVLYGSNDGKNWTGLDVRSGVSFPSRNQTIEFPFINTKSFSRYKIRFDTTGYADFQVAEISVGGISKDNVFGNYSRKLDVINGLHYTNYNVGAAAVSVEVFASFPDQVIVVRYVSSIPGFLSGTIQLNSAHVGSSVLASQIGSLKSLSFNGALDNSMKFAAVLGVLNSGGSLQIAPDQSGLIFANCDTLTLLLDARTDYQMDYDSGWKTSRLPLDVANETVSSAAGKDFSTLKAVHQSDFSSLMSRASVDWGVSSAEIQRQATDIRVQNYSAAVLANEAPVDPDLEQLLYQFNRYLLVSGSRGSLPTNLQGLWNNSNNPPWWSAYFLNINFFMNYWATETTNLSECHLPMLNWIEKNQPAMRAMTQKFYPRVRGWMTGLFSNNIGGTAMVNVGGVNRESTATDIWPAGSSNTILSSNAWLCQHLFEHYNFTQDLGYLRNRAYKIIKEICQYWDDSLVDVGGVLMTNFDYSSEHGNWSRGVMLNQQLVWDLFDNYIKAEEILKIDPAYSEKIAVKQARLAPNKIGSWGQLQEWQSDWDSKTNIHRHTSHLVAVYPGRQITPYASPAYAAAALKSLRARCGTQGNPLTAVPSAPKSSQSEYWTSWAMAWRIGIFARLGSGNEADYMVRCLLANCTSPNLLTDSKGVFQIDGNYGYPAGVTEMLLQSHDGKIRLLPALPTSWKTGSFTGLKARGGYRVDCRWENGEVTNFVIHADPNTRAVTVVVNGRETTGKPLST